MERSTRTLKEKVEILKGSLSYDLPIHLERTVFYYAVYLLNRTWNSNTGVSTPWELHTGEKLDLKQSPLVKYGTVAVFHQPLSLSHMMCIFRLVVLSCREGGTIG